MMSMTPIRRPFLTPLRRIATPKGDVLHGMKCHDPGFGGFGEAYFSMVLPGAVKGWKRHREMTLNLICPQGAVRVVVHAGEPHVDMLDVVLSPDAPDTYCRLTVPPGHWVGFAGWSEGPNLILNLASCLHDPAEADTLPLDAFVWPERQPDHP